MNWTAIKIIAHPYKHIRVTYAADGVHFISEGVCSLSNTHRVIEWYIHICHIHLGVLIFLNTKHTFWWDNSHLQLTGWKTFLSPFDQHIIRRRKVSVYLHSLHPPSSVQKKSLYMREKQTSSSRSRSWWTWIHLPTFLSFYLPKQAHASRKDPACVWLEVHWKLNKQNNTKRLLSLEKKAS